MVPVIFMGSENIYMGCYFDKIWFWKWCWTAANFLFLCQSFLQTCCILSCGNMLAAENLSQLIRLHFVLHLSYPLCGH
jgi:hypothetical protein